MKTDPHAFPARVVAAAVVVVVAAALVAATPTIASAAVADLLGKHTPPSPSELQLAGTAVAAGDTRFAIGSPQADLAGTNVGAVYVVSDSGTDVVTPPAGSPSSLRAGTTVAIDGDWLAMGAPRAAAPSSSTGRVLLYHHDGQDWVHLGDVPNPDPTAYSYFGSSLALVDDVLVVGADGATVNGFRGAGAAHVYTLADGAATLAQSVPNPVPVANDRFGAVAYSDGTLVVGARDTDAASISNSGMVHVYTGQPGSLSLLASLASPEGSASDKLGTAVAVDGSYIAAGAPAADVVTDATYRDAGLVWVWELVDGAVTGPTKVQAITLHGDALLGTSVALQDGTLVAGAPGDGADVDGAVHYFTSPQTAWSEGDVLTALDGGRYDLLGQSVATAPLDGGAFVIAGAPEHDPIYVVNGRDTRFDDTGAAYLFSTTDLPPTAAADTYTATEDVDLVVPAPGLLANDVDHGDLELTATLVDQPAHGTVTVNADGSFTYLADSHYSGPDSFTYAASNGVRQSDPATVTVTVDPVPDAPEVSAETLTGPSTVEVPVNFDGILVDEDGSEVLSYTLLEVPDHVTFTAGTANDDGSWTFTAADRDDLAILSTVQADVTMPLLVHATEQATSETATTQVAWTVEFGSAPVAPEPQPDTYTVVEDTLSSRGSVLDNDVDANPEDRLTAVLVEAPAMARQFNLGSNGQFTYTSALHYSGPDHFTYEVTDGRFTVGPVRVDITVDGKADRPWLTVEPVAGPVGTDVPVPAEVYTNDVDGSETVELVLSGIPSHVTLSAGTHDGNGTWTIPQADVADLTATSTQGGRFPVDYTGVATEIDNGHQTTSEERTVWEFTVPAEAPVVTDDSYTGLEDTQVVVEAPGVLDNDTDINDDAMTAQVHTAPSHGTVEMEANGAFIYTPAPGWAGTDTFTYTATDETGLTSTEATVTLEIAADADTPTITVDPAEVLTDPGVAQPITVTVASGDPDGSEQLHVVATDVDPAVTFSAGTDHGDGTWTFSPADLDGLHVTLDGRGRYPMTFTAVATETTNGDTAEASAPFTIASINQPPTLADDTYEHVEDGGALEVPAPGVAANDVDVDGDRFTVTLLDGPTVGTLDLSDDGAFTFQAPADFAGQVTFTYTATDSDGNTADPATVTVLIDGVADTPTITAADVEGATGTTVDLHIDAAQTDTDGSEELQVTLSGIPADVTVIGATDLGDGTWLVHADAERLALTSAVEQTFDVVATVTARDMDDAAEASATFTVTLIDPSVAPVAARDAYVTDEDVTLDVPAPGVLGNDTDDNGDPLTATLVTGPGHGTVTLNADGSFTYVPDAHYAGPDSFTYVADDGALQSDPVIVNVAVIAVADDPTVQAADVHGHIDTDVPVDLTVASADTDGSETFTVTITGVADGVTFSAGTDQGDGTWTFTGDELAGLTLTADAPVHFEVTAAGTGTDGDDVADGPAVTFTVTIVHPPTAPAVADDHHTTMEDVTLDVPAPGVLVNDDDLNGDTFTAEVADEPGHGTVTLNPDGSFTYTPDAHYSGPDSFSYVATDSTGLASTPSTVTIDITPVADVPTFGVEADDPTNDGYATLRITVAELVDTDGSELLSDIVVTDVPDDVTLSAGAKQSDGSWLVPADVDSFTVTAPTDRGHTLTLTLTATEQATGEQASATFEVTVTIDHPLLVVDTDFEILEDTTLAGDVLVDVDPDLRTDLVVTLVGDPILGTVDLNADGTFTYVPALHVAGVDTFTYEVFDGSTRVEAIATVVITPVADLPLINLIAGDSGEDDQDCETRRGHGNGHAPSCGDHDNGHGNDPDRCDESNPGHRGRGNGNGRPCADGTASHDHDNGHGNDPDRCDESNPGHRGNGNDRPCADSGDDDDRCDRGRGNGKDCDGKKPGKDRAASHDRGNIDESSSTDGGARHGKHDDDRCDRGRHDCDDDRCDRGRGNGNGKHCDTADAPSDQLLATFTVTLVDTDGSEDLQVTVTPDDDTATCQVTNGIAHTVGWLLDPVPTPDKVIEVRCDTTTGLTVTAIATETGNGDPATATATATA